MSFAAHIYPGCWILYVQLVAYICPARWIYMPCMQGIYGVYPLFRALMKTGLFGYIRYVHQLDIEHFHPGRRSEGDYPAYRNSSRFRQREGQGMLSSHIGVTVLAISQCFFFNRSMSGNTLPRLAARYPFIPLLPPSSSHSN